MRAISSVLPRINSTAINKLESNLHNNKVENSSNQKKKNLPDRKLKKFKKYIIKKKERKNLVFCEMIEAEESEMNTAKDSRRVTRFKHLRRKMKSSLWISVTNFLEKT